MYCTICKNHLTSIFASLSYNTQPTVTWSRAMVVMLNILDTVSRTGVCCCHRICNVYGNDLLPVLGRQRTGRLFLWREWSVWGTGNFILLLYYTDSVAPDEMSQLLPEWVYKAWLDEVEWFGHADVPATLAFWFTKPFRLGTRDLQSLRLSAQHMKWLNTMRLCNRLNITGKPND